VLKGVGMKEIIEHVGVVFAVIAVGAYLCMILAPLFVDDIKKKKGE
jgi:hypothetical protein